LDARQERVGTNIGDYALKLEGLEILSDFYSELYFSLVGESDTRAPEFADLQFHELIINRHLQWHG
jgi:hypothetical protein